MNSKRSKLRDKDISDIPSDISEDEWGEIQKFGQHLYHEK